MHSPFYTTTRLFLKRAWAGGLLTVSLLVLVPLSYRMLFGAVQEARAPVSHDLFDLHIVYLVLSSVFFLAVCYYAIQGSQKICMGLPVRSTSIATWMMLATVCLTVVLQLVTNGVYRLLFFDSHWLSDYWPLLGPLLFLVTLIFVGHAIYWSLYALSLTRVLGGTILVVGLFWWFVARYFPQGYQQPALAWKHVTLTEFLTLLIVSGEAWYFGTREFAKVRAGSATPSPHWQRLQAWWNSIVTGKVTESASTPISISESLVKLHWRDSCQRSVLLCGLLFGLLGFVVGLAAIQGGGASVSQILHYILLTMLVTCVIGGILFAFQIGEGICFRGRAAMQTCLATVPLSDREFSRTLFRNLVKAVLSVFLLIQLGGVLTLLAAMLQQGTALLHWELVQGFGVLLGYSCWYLFGFWIITMNFIALYWTGRTWFIYGVIGAAAILFAAIVGVGNYLRDRYPAMLGSSTWTVFDYFLIATFLSLTLLIWGFTLFVFISACRKQLIRVSTAVAVLMFWALGVLLTFGYLLPPFGTTHFFEDLSARLLLVALCTLSLTPIATVPLALRWNRHR